MVTGATGYIGSHVCVELLGAGNRIVGIDNFDNSSPLVVDRIRRLAGHFDFVELDLADRAGLERVFDTRKIDAVVHLAGLKAVAESTTDPLHYFDVNVGTSISLLQAMKRHAVTGLIFSSSCTVYGNPRSELMPLTERAPIAPINPYGHTKAIIEQMLSAQVEADPRWRTISLRYFNPIGAHASGIIGESPLGTPNTLMPHLMDVALGRTDHLVVHGGDYDTVDGTCVRDYIHVVDVARAHVAAVAKVMAPHQPMVDDPTRFMTVNLGTGVGCSVLQLLAAVEDSVGSRLPYRIGPRRPGDAAAVWADPSLARHLLGWHARHDLVDMCRDQWNWARRHPCGFDRQSMAAVSS